MEQFSTPGQAGNTGDVPAGRTHTQIQLSLKTVDALRKLKHYPTIISYEAVIKMLLEEHIMSRQK